MRTTFGDMEHLATEAVVAFADGELGMTAYQRAAAHLGACAECAADLDAQRCARTAVRSAAPLLMPADLLEMLCRIPETSTLDRELSSAPARGQDAAADSGQLQPRGGAATARTKRSLPLGVLAVSALAVGVLSVTAGATGPAAPGPVAPDQPVQVAAGRAQHGAQVVAASYTAHARLVSFGVLFTASDEASRAPQIGSDQVRSALTMPPQTRTSP